MSFHLIFHWFTHRWHYGTDFRICLTCNKVEYP